MEATGPPSHLPTGCTRMSLSMTSISTLQRKIRNLGDSSKWEHLRGVRSVANLSKFVFDGYTLDAYRYTLSISCFHLLVVHIASFTNLDIFNFGPDLTKNAKPDIPSRAIKPGN